MTKKTYTIQEVNKYINRIKTKAKGLGIEAQFKSLVEYKVKSGVKQIGDCKVVGSINEHIKKLQKPKNNLIWIDTKGVTRESSRADEEIGDIKTLVQFGSNIKSLSIVGDEDRELDIQDLQLPKQLTHLSFTHWGNKAFNGLPQWDTSNLIDMSFMFYTCPNFNQSVSTLNTKSATNMDYMFQYCSNFNQPVSNFDTSNVTSMKGTFSGCEKFDQDCSMWNVAKVEVHRSFNSGGILKPEQLPKWKD